MRPRINKEGKGKHWKVETARKTGTMGGGVPNQAQMEGEGRIESLGRDVESIRTKLLERGFFSSQCGRGKCPEDNKLPGGE